MVCCFEQNLLKLLSSWIGKLVTFYLWNCVMEPFMILISDYCKPLIQKNTKYHVISQNPSRPFMGTLWAFLGGELWFLFYHFFLLEHFCLWMSYIKSVTAPVLLFPLFLPTLRHETVLFQLPTLSTPKKQKSIFSVKKFS